ncbi:MAG: hypothetical protein K0R29_478 [Pseudobdellovibrio sp.]|jgi:predicted PurR-regulated permease PerM|nr:hypothetical protein [Pseudobdellovibrio sp.]
MELFVNQKNLYRFLVFAVCTIICVCVFFPFLTSIFVAAIFAQVLHPIVFRLQLLKFKNLGLQSRALSTAIVLVSLFMAFSLPFGIVGKKVYTEAVQISDTEVAKQKLVSKLEEVETEISKTIRKLGLAKQVSAEDFSSGLANKAANYIFDAGAAFMAGVPGLLIKFLIFTAALYFFLAETEKISGFSRKIGIFSQRELQIVRESFKISSHAAVVSTVLVGLIRGCIVAIGAELAGAGDFYVILVLSFFASFIPVVGAVAMAVGLCASALLEQNYTGALGLLGVVLFASAVDNLIRPFFLAYGNQGVHPFVSLLSVLGGMALFGMSGVFIGPVLVQVTFDVLPKLVKLNPESNSGLSNEQNQVPPNNEKLVFTKEEVWNSI